MFQLSKNIQTEFPGEIFPELLLFENGKLFVHPVF